MAQLWQKDAPIIRSALETDVYKILMLYYISEYYPFLDVQWAFKNRTKTVPLAQYVSVGALREQLQAVQELRFSEADIAYLRGWDMFPESFLRTLQKLRLPQPHLFEQDGQLCIEAHGSWLETTLWEIYILPLVAELYGRGRAAAEGISEATLYQEGTRRLDQKVTFLKRHPELKLALFGLRRRFSGLWEDTVTDAMLTGTSGNITGASNVFLAKRFGVEAVGTNAHELPMAEYAAARHQSPNAVRYAPYQVLERWQKLYGHKALIMLPDTFGTEAFLRDLPAEFAWQWRGYRQDSGDARTIGEQYIADYERRGIDPRDKLILFTDGLDCQRMLQLYEAFVGRIGVGFGVGTNFTNDLGLVEPLSVVMKLMAAAGNPTVKLSDNLAKAMGPTAEIETAKQLFGYTGDFNEATRY